MMGNERYDGAGLCLWCGMENGLNVDGFCETCVKESNEGADELERIANLKEDREVTQWRLSQLAKEIKGATDGK